jgi:RHS repeat-associated protein
MDQRFPRPMARYALVFMLASSLPASSIAAPLPPQASAPRSLTASQGLVTVGDEGNGGWGARVTALPDAFTGVLSHRIPLQIPAGRHNVAPSLALTYSSAGSSGFIGMGWELPLGAIERSTKHGVSYASDDFVLNLGAPVEIVNVGGLEYRAKIESTFRRIRKLTAADGRAYWEVTDRTGTRFFFGQTAAARQDNPQDGSQIFRWCLDRVEDTHGNYYTASYFKDQGEIYPDVIAYTGGTGLAPTNTVRFWRDAAARTDSAVVYTPSFGIRTAYRLQSIEVRTNGTVDRVYGLEYDVGASTARSRLVAVRQIGSDGVVSTSTGIATGSALPATAFSYTAGSPPSSTSFAGPSVRVAASLLNQVNADLVRLMYADFNGDGRTDIAFVDGSSSSLPIKIFIANGSGFNAAINGPVRWIGSGTSTVLNDVARIKLGDFNGDGRTDLLCIESSTNTPISIYLADASGGFPAQPSFKGPPVLVGAPDVDVSRLLLADFDGDSKTDILYLRGTATTASPIEVYLSTGSAFGSRILGPQYSVPNGSAGVAALARVKLGDFNGDRRTDIGFVNGSGQTLPMTIYALAANATAVSFLMNGPSRFVRADVEGSRVDASRLMSADVNGDGKTDLLALEGSSTTVPMSVYLATGTGFAAPFAGPSRYFDNLYPDQSLGRVRLADVNGDGRSDVAFVEGTSGANAMSIHLSEGSRFRGAIAGPVRTVSGGTALAQELLRIAIGDFDGDGRADIAGNDSSGVATPMSIYRSQGLYPDLLATVSNGVGGSMSVAYVASPSWPGMQSPIPLQTVQTVTKVDGNGVTAMTTYGFSGGYYHLGEREFRGFHRVDVTSPAGPNGEQSETRHWFHQGNDAGVDVNDPSGAIGCTKGKPYRVQVWDLQKATYAETLTSYWPSVTSPCFTPPSEVTTQHCEQTGCGRRRTVSYADFVSGVAVSGYDGWGNLLRANDFGDESTAADDRTVVRAYSPNTTKWIVGLPASETVYGGAGPATSLAPANRLADIWFSYDGTLDAASCASSGASTTPTRGQPTRVVHWLNGGTSPEEWTGYDDYGNVVCTSDADRRLTTFGYDGSKTFRMMVTNAKGHVTTTQYYGVDGVAANLGRHGQTKKVTDPNLAETSFEYDTFGRKTKEIRPPVPSPLAGDPYPGFTAITSYFLGGVGTNRVETLTSAGEWSAEYFDGLGRTYLTKKRGSSATGARVFAIKTQYNATGTMLRTSLPYEDVAGATLRWITTVYDGQGRGTRTTKQDGTQTLTCFRDLDGSSTSVDAKGQRRRQIVDAHGNLVWVQEYKGTFATCTTDEGTPYATTQYQYDRMRRLTQVTDAAGTPFATDYDTLGRVKFLSDPDLGTWYYDYTASGDPLWQQDANGTFASPTYRTWFQHDALHRMTLKDLPTGADVSYVYDDPTVPYSKGRPTRMIDASGSTEYAYDAIGRAWRTTRTIDGTAYATTTGYDAAGRVSRESVARGGAADPTATTYDYDVDGLLWKVNAGGLTHATLAGYNALRQPGSIAFRNGVHTTYTYYDTGNNRVRNIASTIGATPIVNLTYAYDDVRNITSVTDAVDTAATFTFGYDELNRLTSAASSAFGSLAYTYDPIGNLKSKEGVTYTYDPVKVHAVAATSDGRTYAYDANGNVRADGTRSIDYDDENRPLSVAGGGRTVQITYDGDGQRVTKQVLTGSTVTSSTVYVGRLYECTNGTCTKHLFAGDKRVASIEDGGATRYYHLDHLDSTRATTDQNGAWTEAVVYKPFGDGDAPVEGASKYRFTSKELDLETGLYFYGARYYNPVLGRFISPDPIAPTLDDPQTLNRFAYGRNNPVFYNDPSGYASDDPQSMDLDALLEGNSTPNATGADQLVFAGDAETDAFIARTPPADASTARSTRSLLLSREVFDGTNRGAQALTLDEGSRQTHTTGWTDVTHETHPWEFAEFSLLKTAAVYRAAQIPGVDGLMKGLAGAAATNYAMDRTELEVKVDYSTLVAREWFGIVEHRLGWSGGPQFQTVFDYHGSGPPQRMVVDANVSYRVMSFGQPVFEYRQPVPGLGGTDPNPSSPYPTHDTTIAR